MKSLKQTSVAATLGAVVVGSLAATGTANANPFAMTQLSSGYELSSTFEAKCGEGKCGGDKPAKAGEGKCGEGKCGSM